MDWYNMPYSNQLLLPKLRELQAESRPVTATEIARLTGIPFGTVKSQIYKLEKAGVIRRRRVGRRWGSFIEVVE